MKKISFKWPFGKKDPPIMPQAEGNKKSNNVPSVSPGRVSVPEDSNFISSLKSSTAIIVMSKVLLKIYVVFGLITSVKTKNE